MQRAGVARHLGAALDQRGVDGAAAEQRVGARGERGVELADPGQDRAGLDDRVDALLVARAVRRAALDLDLDPHEALVGDDQLELGRLGDDRGVGACRRRAPPARRGSRAPRRRPRRRARRRGARGRRAARRRARTSCRRRRGRTGGRPRAAACAGRPCPRRRRCRGARTASASCPPPRRACAPRRSAARASPRARRRRGRARSAHAATKRAISASPAPPGTSAGLTESIATSRRDELDELVAHARVGSRNHRLLRHPAAEEARHQARPPPAAGRRARRLRARRTCPRACSAHAGERRGRRHRRLPHPPGRAGEADAGAARADGQGRGAVDRVAEARRRRSRPT